MHQEQRQRTHHLLKSKGIHRTFFADPNTVNWLTGFAAPTQMGPSPFAAAPPLLWYEDGHYTLFIVDSQAGFAAEFGQDADAEIVTYLGYTIQHPIAGAHYLEQALREKLKSMPAYEHEIGIEAQHLPLFLGNILLKDAKTLQIDSWLTPLRMVKTAEEQAKLRVNFALADIGHAAVRQTLQAGQREIDVWMNIESATQKAAGQRVAVGNDCVVGYRENNIGGWPGDLVINPGDSLMVDISTTRYGYWSDSCATYIVGEPGAKHKAMHKVISDALDLAISLVRPGVMAKTIDEKVRDFIAQAGYPVYPHHTGHGVGVTGHEAPRIVPYSEEILAPGMVIMLEPGTYFPGETGVRLEDALLVTEDGAEVLTHHNKSLV